MFENISTKELADCIGKTIGFASQIKHGHRPLPKKYLLSVSARFDISLEKLCDPGLQSASKANGINTETVASCQLSRSNP